MLGFLSLLGTKWTGLGKWRLPIVVGVLAALAMSLAYCTGRGDGKTGEKLKQADAAAKLDARADRADAAAADARVADTRDTLTKQQELTDATRDATSADDARRLRGCAILRQQGRDTSKIAACR